MFKIPSISDTPNTVKTRPGFHDPNDLIRATPSFTKSVSRDNLLQSSSVVCGLNERDEFRDVSNSNSNNVVAVRSFELNEDPSFWKDHNVQVIIRLRPLNSSEISLQGHNKCVRQESCQTITWTGHPESRFTFDVVADETVTQEKLFQVAGVPMVENCVGGYNSCMFAYGQTGSGKTHTMLGDIEGGTRRHSVNCGMTPRVFEYLFSRIQKEKEARRDEKFRFTCKCSFLEIYNEQILDLLNPSSLNLQIREDLKKGVYVENLTEVEVSCAREVMQQLLEGASNRKVAATNMNRASSRSHSVFTCVIESTWESQGVTHHRFARLNLVDLAGSERQKSSGAEGERLKEATNINKSLSTLGLVIMNLVSISNGKSLHVPYRDSKLTFLLQDSLGGNSKTTIIANVSPSSCCSLETLSTLKFAQRAKFIKNNAIVNEDASGDVLAMRMQIQQLKKEVSHLRGLLSGGGGLNHDSDHTSVGLVGFLTSPGPLKWEGLNGTLSPLTSDKRMSQKEYEVALVGAFRREKDKDMALQSLTAENKAAMQLAKQREDEIQGLKMRLRFREAGIKRLEGVASGKISAETHLLKEKEEHLREIAVLRAQVDRNQEVTRFAMENLRLKEEIRRLKSLYEEGEVERMSEQITILQNKLLEALDWKLMNETEPSNKQRTPDFLADNCSELDRLNSDKKLVSPWQTSIKEENEFLRLQAIQNQAEIDSLRKKLNSCMEEKATLKRHAEDLEKELDAMRTSKEATEERHALQINLTSKAANEINKISLDDQMELKAMVDAIATASQREAEAHEIAITLTKENDELRAKIKVLLEDNNKLIELYERAVAETNHKALITATSDEKGADKNKLGKLEHHIEELNEENEKLMSLYEKAMKERDDLKKKLVEVDGGGDSSTSMDIDEPTLFDEGETVVENSFVRCTLAPFNVTKTAVQIDTELDEHKNITEADSTVESCETVTEEKNSVKFDVDKNLTEANSSEDCFSETAIKHRDENQVVQTSPGCNPRVIEEKIVLVKKKLEIARDRLSSSSETVSEFVVLENAVLNVEKLSKEITSTKNLMQLNQQQIGSIKLDSSGALERNSIILNKLSSLKASLSSITSSIAYFEQREARARARVEASLLYLEQSAVIYTCVKAKGDEMNSKRREIHVAEAEARKKHSLLKSKLEEENKRLENERVLFAIDNVDWKMASKAIDLIKSEESKIKLQDEIERSREKLGALNKGIEQVNRACYEVDFKIRAASLEMEKASKIVKETELGLQNVIHEKEGLLEMREGGKTDIDNLICEYHQSIFEECMREEVLKILEEYELTMSTKLDELQAERADYVLRATKVLNGDGREKCLPSERMRAELRDVLDSILEAESLLPCLVGEV